MGCITSDDWTDIAERYPESTLKDELDEAMKGTFSVGEPFVPFDFSCYQAVSYATYSSAPVTFDSGTKKT